MDMFKDDETEAQKVAKAYLVSHTSGLSRLKWIDFVFNFCFGRVECYLFLTGNFFFLIAK